MDDYAIEKILDFAKPKENIYKTLFTQLLAYISTDDYIYLVEDFVDIIIKSNNQVETFIEFNNIAFFYNNLNWTRFINECDRKMFKYIFENYKNEIDEEFLSEKKFKQYKWLLLMQDIID
jgi:hypothetical protein